MFYLLTFLYSWSFWGIAIILGQEWNEFPTLIFYALGGIGPSLMGILLVYLNKEKEGQQEFWNRIYNPKRISGVWYLIILFFWFIPLLISIGLDLILGGAGAAPGYLAEYFIKPLLLAPSITFLIVGVLAEELGWRGYSLEQLQENLSALKSSFIIGIFWALWHIPLYFIKGTFQYNNNFGSLLFWLYTLHIIPEAFLYTCIYNNTNRSTLSALLFHFMGNFIGELFDFSVRVQIFRLLITTTIVIVISLKWGKNNYKMYSSGV